MRGLAPRIHQKRRVDSIRWIAGSSPAMTNVAASSQLENALDCAGRLGQHAMLTALLADIHANREALAACLADAQARGVARHVFLGDYVGYGADPGWVVDTVVALVAAGATAILGNHDAAVFDRTVDMGDSARIALDWTRERLAPGQRDFLRGLPLTGEAGDHLFVHASAWQPARWDYVTGPAAALRSFEATQHRITLC